MTSTIQTYVGNGAQTDFGFSFEYLRKEFVKVLIDAVEVPFTFHTAQTVKVVPAPEAGRTVVITRRTDTDRLVTFVDGSVLLSNDLNVAQIQAIHIAAEARDVAAGSLLIDDSGAYSTGFRRLTNLGEPTQPLDAVSKEWVETANTSAVSQAAAAKAAAEAAAGASQASATASAGFSATATTKASEASTSATNANTSAVASAGSATAAAGSATTATTKAAEAAASATAAAGSATTASTKAAEAAASAAAAAAANYDATNVNITGGVIGGISNLGLATPAPSIAGYSTLRMEGTSGGNIEFTVGGSVKAELYSSTAGALRIGTKGSNELYLRTNGTSRLTIDGAGDVGIGTTSPGAKLDVAGTAQATSFKVGNYTVEVVAGNLEFSHSGVKIMRLDASGNLTVIGNVTAYGAIT